MSREFDEVTRIEGIFALDEHEATPDDLDYLARFMIGSNRYTMSSVVSVMQDETLTVPERFSLLRAVDELSEDETTLHAFFTPGSGSFLEAFPEYYQVLHGDTISPWNPGPRVYDQEAETRSIRRLGYAKIAAGIALLTHVGSEMIHRASAGYELLSPEPRKFLTEAIFAGIGFLAVKSGKKDIEQI